LTGKTKLGVKTDVKLFLPDGCVIDEDEVLNSTITHGVTLLIATSEKGTIKF